MNGWLRPWRRTIIVGLTLALLALLAGCSEPPDTPIESGTPVPSATAQPVSDTKGGTRGQLQDSASYTSPDLGFSVAYPEEWEVNDASADEDGVVISDGDGTTLLWVLRESFGGSPAQANREGIRFMRELTEELDGVNDLEFAEETQPFRVAGLNGLTLDYYFTNDYDEEIIGTFVVVTTDEGDTYLLTLEAPNESYSDALDELNGMLESFRVSGVRVGPSAPVTAPPSDRAEAEWLFMFYFDADDGVLERDIMVDLNEIERVGSTDQVHLVAQVDRYVGSFSGMGNWTTAKRFYLTNDPDLGRVNSPELADLGEVNMADGETLRDFVTWAMVNYPARKHVLIMSDHGMGWPGGYTDPDPGGQGEHENVFSEMMDDGLWLMELDETLEAVREETGLEKFELIGFDACLMGHLEVFTAMMPHARYSVASQELEPALGWAYTDFLNQVVNDPEMNGADLAQAIVSGYIDQDQRLIDEVARRQFVTENGLDGDESQEEVVALMGEDVTLSAVDLEALAEVNAALTALSEAMPGLDREVINRARGGAQSFENIFDEDVPSPYIDLGHFAKKLERNGDRATKAAAQRLLGAIEQAVIAERSGKARSGASGISLFFPTRKLFKMSDTNWDYDTIAARFVGETGWGDFLQSYYGSRRSSGMATRGGGMVAASQSKPIEIAPLTLSDEVATPSEAVTIQTEVAGENLAFLYTFVGRLLPESEQLIIEDLDYLFSDESEEIDGVVTPLWGEEGVEVEWEWEPTVYAINDGENSVRALLAPVEYGEVPTYAVEGTYRFVNGSTTRYAKLFFKDGELSAVFGFTGQGGMGAPRQITPEPGDQFVILEQGRSVGERAEAEFFTREGGTLTFGDTPFSVEALDAPSGTYVVGVIAEDADGEQFEQFETIFVEGGEAEVAGFVPFTSEALGIALLHPEAWQVEEDSSEGQVSFAPESDPIQAFLIQGSYPEATSSAEANAQGVTDALAGLEASGALEALTLADETTPILLGAFDAVGQDFSFELDGVPFRGQIIVTTPVAGTTYALIFQAADERYDAVYAASFAPMLESFDILISGAPKEAPGEAAAPFAEGTSVDDFTDPESGLADFEDEGSIGTYQDERYRFELQPYAGPYYTFYEGETLPENFLLEVSAESEGAANNGYGLIFRVEDDDHFYLFRISGDGFYTVEAAEGDDLLTLVEWTASDQIQQTPGAVNVLSVEGQGSEYRFAINGQVVETLDDDRYEGGAYGLLADNFDEQAPTTVSFDDLTVGEAAR